VPDGRALQLDRDAAVGVHTHIHRVSGGVLDAVIVFGHVAAAALCLRSEE
jgi:hypothetical protein